MAKKPGKNKGGRPSEFTQELADTICRRIVNGESLKRICQDEVMPNVVTVLRWVRANDEFCNQYALAKQEQAEALADEIVSIADTADKDTANAVKVKVDARKWVAAKLLPKKYGEKQQIDMSVEATVRTLNDEQLRSKLTELLRKAGIGHATGGTGAAQEKK